MDLPKKPTGPDPKDPTPDDESRTPPPRGFQGSWSDERASVGVEGRRDVDVESSETIEPDAPTPDSADSDAAANEPVRPSVRHSPSKPLRRGQGTVICVGRDHIAAIGVDGRGPSIALRSLAEELIETPHDELLKLNPLRHILEPFGRTLDALPKRSRRLTILLDEPHLSERFLHFPKVKEKDLDQLVARKATTEQADITGHLVLCPSYQGGHEGLGVLAAMTRGVLLDALQKTAQSRGCSVKAFVSKPVAGQALAPLFADDVALPDRHLLIELRAGNLRLSLIDHQQMRFSRDLDIGWPIEPADAASRITTEVQRTKIFLASRLRQAPITDAVVLIEEEDLQVAIKGRLEAQFDFDVVSVAPKIRFETEAPDRARRWAAAASALICAKRGDHLASITVKSPFAQSQARAFWQIPPIVAACGLVVGSILLWNGSISREHGRLEKIANGLRGRSGKFLTTAQEAAEIAATRDGFHREGRGARDRIADPALRSIASRRHPFTRPARNRHRAQSIHLRLRDRPNSRRDQGGRGRTPTAPGHPERGGTVRPRDGPFRDGEIRRDARSQPLRRPLPQPLRLLRSLCAAGRDPDDQALSHRDQTRNRGSEMMRLKWFLIGLPILSIVGSAAFVGLHTWPLRTEKIGLQEEIEWLSQGIRDEQSQRRSIEDFRSTEEHQIAAADRLLTERVGTTTRGPDLLPIVGDLGDRAGAKVMSSFVADEPEAPAPKVAASPMAKVQVNEEPHYSTISLATRLEGGAGEILDFLGLLESSERPISVRDVELRRHPTDHLALEASVVADFVVLNPFR